MEYNDNERETTLNLVNKLTNVSRIASLVRPTL